MHHVYYSYAHYAALWRVYNTAYQLSWYFFHRSFLPEACTKLLFSLQSHCDCVKVKHKLSKDVGEPPPWGYPQEGPPDPTNPLRAWFPQNLVRSHGAERNCSQTAARCQLAKTWLHNLPKLSECVFKRAGALQQKHSGSHWMSHGSNLGGAEKEVGVCNPQQLSFCLWIAQLWVCAMLLCSTECCSCKFERRIFTLIPHQSLFSDIHLILHLSCNPQKRIVILASL